MLNIEKLQNITRLNIEKIQIAVLTIVISLLLIIFSYQSIIYDKDFYEEEFKANGVYDKYGAAVVDNENENIMSYLLENKPLNRDNGLLSEQDIRHLADVKNIMQNMTYLSYALVAICLLLYFKSNYKKKRVDNFNKVDDVDNNNVNKYDNNNKYKGSLLFPKSFIYGGILNVVAVFSLFISGYNFEYFFTIFHKIFFSNDLWLMDSARDILVNLYPQEFWMHALTKILKLSFILSMIFIALGAITIFFLKKHLNMHQSAQVEQTKKE